MEFDAKTQFCKSSNYLTSDDITITFSSQYSETVSDLVHLLNPDLNMGQGQGWNSGGFPTQWIAIHLKKPTFIEEVQLVVNILPNCQVSYVWEIEIPQEFANKKRKIVEEVYSEMHVTGSVIKLRVGQVIKSFMIKTTASQSWVAWKRILFVKERED